MAVHKISAKDNASSSNSAAAGTPPKAVKATKKTAPKAVKATKVATERTVPAFFKPFVAIGGYFKGAWFELREVRWPTRKATWSLTGAVLVFTALIAAIILLLDAGFKFLFEIILR